MSQIKPVPDGQPPTLEQWRAWAETATRNLTDSPIGRHTAGKREIDARNSELVTDTGIVAEALAHIRPVTANEGGAA